MSDLKKMFFALAFFAGLTPLCAQEPWETGFKITAGTMSNAEENFLGQNKTYGLAIFGAYPLSVHGAGVLEFGYKVFPTTATDYGMTVVDDLSDMYFADALYKYELWRNGVYLMGGVRAMNTRTVRDIISKGASEDGGNIKERSKGDRQTKAGWRFAAGYRLTDFWSLEIGASSASFKNVPGQTVSGTIFEIALCVHR